jgi:uncharacterized protein (TIGR02466 family)
MDLSIHNLFPTAVGFAELNRPLSDEELFFVRQLETRQNTGNTTSTDNFVLRSPVLTSLRSFIEDSVAEYFKATTNPKHDVTLRVTQSWVNYSEPGQYHHKHAHPNSFISGVFYIQTNPNDKIYFYRSGWQQIKFPPAEWNTYNSESWWYEAVAGKLILFPSSLEHMVPTVEGDVVRISLSFNTFPVGMVGEEVDLTALRLEA